MILAALGCFVTLLLALLDINIVSSVSWKMARDLDPAHGIDLLPWMVTSYALADCVVVPLYGKLADVQGAKRVYVAALVIFLIGSSLSGLARNMVELIVFRTVQGVGGGFMSVTMVILGTLFRDDNKNATKVGMRVAWGASWSGSASRPRPSGPTSSWATRPGSRGSAGSWHATSATASPARAN